MGPFEDEYIAWLFDLVCYDKRGGILTTYGTLLRALYNREFTWSIDHDVNRAYDGIELRSRFMSERTDLQTPRRINKFLNKPCSILEMMIALAVRCETTIMDDPRFGDRTTQWFWVMIRSLGLINMCDENFDEVALNQILDNLLNRNYQANGSGGLFTVNEPPYDLRDVEIWYQLCWYLDVIDY